jgi:ABC-type glycerol-3-phosphate transport system substrate-binding protein
MNRSNHNDQDKTSGVSRRTVLKGALLGAGALAAPKFFIGRAQAAGQYMDLAAFEAAGIDWRMADGAQITVAVIPAGYFKNLETVLPDFEALTGIKVLLEMIPPGQIRQKAILDLSTKTGTYATHAADPMYYQLYVARKNTSPMPPKSTIRIIVYGVVRCAVSAAPGRICISIRRSSAPTAASGSTASA